MQGLDAHVQMDRCRGWIHAEVSAAPHAGAPHVRVGAMEGMVYTPGGTGHSMLWYGIAAVGWYGWMYVSTHLAEDVFRDVESWMDTCTRCSREDVLCTPFPSPQHPTAWCAVWCMPLGYRGMGWY